MNQIGIFNETEEDLGVLKTDIKNVIKLALKKEKVKNASCNVIFVGSEKIHELNKTYRNVDRATDVISFALEDGMPMPTKERVLGDIYICIPRAHEQAEEYGHSFKREICFLAVHGIFHLLGYDHMNPHDEKIMFAKQEEVLSEYGIVR